MTDQDFTPIIFASAGGEVPSELSPQSIKVAKMVCLLESKGYFGEIKINFQGGKISHAATTQTVRI